MDTKTRFLKTAAELFQRQGYSGTGLKQLTQDADAPWGSLYHFFPGGKEQLAAEALEMAATAHAQELADLFGKVDLREAARLLFRNEIRVLEQSGFAEGCPIAGVALDVASSSEKVRTACSAGFATWQAAIAEGASRAGAPPHAARAMAAFILATLEGAILLSRAHRSTEALRDAAAYVDLALTKRLEQGWSA